MSTHVWMNVYYCVDGVYYRDGGQPYDAGIFNVLINGETIESGVNWSFNYEAPAGTRYEIRPATGDWYWLAGAVVGDKHPNNQELSGVFPDHDFNVVIDVRSGDICRLSYNRMGGAVDCPSDVYVQLGEGVQLTYLDDHVTQTEFMRFKGWTTDPNGKTIEYHPGDKIAILDDIVLYALWEPILKINYYSNYADSGQHRGANLYLDASKNILMSSDELICNHIYLNLMLEEIESDNGFYLSKKGYVPTGFWGTSPIGGKLISSSTVYISAEELAQAIGIDLDNSLGAVVNLYVQWESAQASMYKKISGEWISGPSYFKVDGVWRPVTKVFRKVNGQWI